MAMITPPQIGRDDDAFSDYLIGPINDADGNPMPLRVVKVWEDIATDSGLELLTSWVAAPGSPAYASSSTFTVTGDQSDRYKAGTPLRYTLDSGVTWAYTYVSSYASPTVTIANPGLTASLDAVQLAGDYLGSVHDARRSADDDSAVPG